MLCGECSHDTHSCSSNDCTTPSGEEAICDLVNSAAVQSSYSESQDFDKDTTSHTDLFGGDAHVGSGTTDMTNHTKFDALMTRAGTVVLTGVVTSVRGVKGKCSVSFNLTASTYQLSLGAQGQQIDTQTAVDEIKRTCQYSNETSVEVMGQFAECTNEDIECDCHSCVVEVREHGSADKATMCCADVVKEEQLR